MHIYTRAPALYTRAHIARRWVNYGFAATLRAHGTRRRSNARCVGIVAFPSLSLSLALLLGRESSAATILSSERDCLLARAQRQSLSAMRVDCCSVCNSAIHFHRACISRASTLRDSQIRRFQLSCRLLCQMLSEATRPIGRGFRFFGLEIIYEGSRVPVELFVYSSRHIGFAIGNIVAKYQGTMCVYVGGIST